MPAKGKPNAKDLYAAQLYRQAAHALLRIGTDDRDPADRRAEAKSFAKYAAKALREAVALGAR